MPRGRPAKAAGTKVVALACYVEPALKAEIEKHAASLGVRVQELLRRWIGGGLKAEQVAFGYVPIEPVKTTEPPPIVA